jgi:hypothetical protein
MPTCSIRSIVICSMMGTRLGPSVNCSEGRTGRLERDIAPPRASPALEQDAAQPARRAAARWRQAPPQRAAAATIPRARTGALRRAGANAPGAVTVGAALDAGKPR